MLLKADSMGFSRDSSDKNCACTAEDKKFDLWVKIPLEKKWQTYLQCSCLGNPRTGKAGIYGSLWDCKKVGYNLATKQQS